MRNVIEEKSMELAAVSSSQHEDRLSKLVFISMNKNILKMIKVEHVQLLFTTTEFAKTKLRIELIYKKINFKYIIICLFYFIFFIFLS